MKGNRFEVYNSPTRFTAVPRNRWYWRMRAANGRTIADGSESYSSPNHARRAVSRLVTILNGVGADIYTLKDGRVIGKVRA